MRLLRNVLTCFFLLATGPLHAEEEAPAAAVAITDADVLPYLDQVIDWQRSVTSPNLAPDNARETLLKDAIRDSARKVLENSFDFARAEAAAVDAENATAPGDADEDAKEAAARRARILKRAAENDQQIKTIQSQLENVSKTTKKKDIFLRREQLNAQMKLARAQKELLQTVLTIFNTTDNSDSGSLLGKINSLSRTLQIESGRAVAPPSTKVEVVNNKDAADKDTAQSNDGIFGISAAMFSVTRRKQDLDEMIARTRAVKEANRALIGGLRTSLQEALKQGNDLAASMGADSKKLSENKRQLDNLLARYKQLSTAIVPLGQNALQFESACRSLKEWRELIGEDWDKLFQRLIFRLGLLGICILIPLLLSWVARRATNRYVQDPRRQRQLRIVRRVVLGVVLLIAVVLNFVTEFTSLATFAGFLTAGLAVALQTVLVSLTAHFFFFGRFGVRVGDRVTVSGVTGDVVQLGMLRMYLMELAGNEGDMRPTGRIVAFPNSVLFSSTAFSKQVSGTSYGWKELTFLLDPAVDTALARKKVREAVDAVYGEYKEAIELQNTVLEQSTRLTVKVPAPREEMRVTDEGLAYVVHYPIVLKRTHEIQERITDKLIEAFRQEPDLHLRLTKPLRIEPTTT